MKFHLIIVFVWLCGVMNILIASYAWRHRDANGARIFSFFMFALSIYVLGYSMELASSTLAAMLFWSEIQYIGILSFPTIYLIFTIQYTGSEKWLTPVRAILLFILPAVFLVIKFSDNNLHWIYRTAAVNPDNVIPMLMFEKGPVYYVLVIYNLTVITIGNALLFHKWQTGSSLYRKQTSTLLVVVLFSYLVFAYYQTGLPLIPGYEYLDLNPFVYTFWGLAIWITIFRHGLFDLTPIARDTLIEKLSDGVIVLDGKARLVDANPEALRIFGWNEPPVGQWITNVLKEWFGQIPFDQADCSMRFEAELPCCGRTAYYEVAVSTLKNKEKHRIGYLIVVHEISERKEIEKQLKELSLVDELTGLSNRRGFKVLADQLFHMADRMQMGVALIYIDLDGLKWINDNLGHAAGDQALVEAGKLMAGSFRSSDVIARYGGDEFVILALESADTGEAMLARLTEKLGEANSGQGRHFRLAFSAGMARRHWQEPKDIEVLLEEADRMMYAAKQSKRK